jgi:hypothetical protein
VGGKKQTDMHHRLRRKRARASPGGRGPLPRLAGVLAAAGAAIAELVCPKTAAAQFPVAEITLTMTPIGEISPLLYGMNYVWHMVPASEFRQFDAAMTNIAHYTLARYPGGWAGEWYDWSSNQEIGGKAHPVAPGIDPETFLATVPQASFVTHSLPAVKDPSQIGKVVEHAAGLVRRYGARVKLWEIGNEWWLQRAAKNRPAIRQENLAGYAALVAAAAPAMKQVDPSIQIFATGDWVEPREFATLRELAGPGWAAVDGISVHTYCGNVEPETLCSKIVERANTIRSLTGKDKIYDSEWHIGPKLSKDDFGIRNANQMVIGLRTLAQARIYAAAFWPPVQAEPEIVFTSPDFKQPYASGLLFGWMSRYYRGQALPTAGDLPAAAARSGDGVTLFVASLDAGPRLVRIPLAGTGLSRVVSAEVMFAADDSDPDRSRSAQIVPLQATAGQNTVEFQINPGTQGRGRGWEIARITLQ